MFLLGMVLSKQKLGRFSLTNNKEYSSHRVQCIKFKVQTKKIKQQQKIIHLVLKQITLINHCY